MPAAVSVRRDFSAGELRRLAAATRIGNQSRRLLSLAAVLDGMNRAQAARIDRREAARGAPQRLLCSPDGLKDSWSKGNPPRLSADQQAELAQLVETGPDRVVHGVVRWRRIDLQRLIAERFGVVYHERDSLFTFGLGLNTLGGGGVNYPGDINNPILAGIGPLGNVQGPIGASLMLVQMVPTVAYKVTDRLILGFGPTVEPAERVR